MNIIDLCVTRKLVNQRYQNEKMESQKVIALQASNAMKTVRDCPTIENAIEFSLIENLYLMNSKKKNIKCYGTDVCQAIKTGNYVKQRGKMARESGKTALKTVHPDMCHDPVFCRRNLGCYLWILLPKSEDVIL